jgi:hypothetical protein
MLLLDGWTGKVTSKQYSTAAAICHEEVRLLEKVELLVTPGVVEKVRACSIMAATRESWHELRLNLPA